MAETEKNKVNSRTVWIKETLKENSLDNFKKYFYYTSPAESKVNSGDKRYHFDDKV